MVSVAAYRVANVARGTCCSRRATAEAAGVSGNTNNSKIRSSTRSQSFTPLVTSTLALAQSSTSRLHIQYKYRFTSITHHQSRSEFLSLQPYHQLQCQSRLFHSSSPNNVNPLLPFDALEGIENEDLKEENDSLAKEKKKLKKKVKQKENENKVVKQTKFVEQKDRVYQKPGPGGGVVDAGVGSGSPYQIGAGGTAGTIGGAEVSGSLSGSDSGNDGNDGNSINNSPPNFDQQNNLNNSRQSSMTTEQQNKEAQRQQQEQQEQKQKQKEKEEEESEEEEEEEEEETPKQKRKRKWEERKKRFVSFIFKCLETAGITFASVAILAAAGLTYHRAYESHVLDKMDKAFDVGDTSFDLAIHERASNDGENWVYRPEQKLMDDIVSGKIKGRYFLLIGEKGTGKTSLVLESFSKVNGLNCTTMDAHADPEIFRIRLGKALNFEFFEDYIGSLFSIRGPRDTTAILDIERAFGKLEQVAIRRVKRTKKPLILFINSAHLIRNDEQGINLIELLQQKAEELCGAGLVTMIINSDDYWLYERLKGLGTKLEVLSFKDLNRQQALSALKTARNRYFGEKLDDALANRIYDLVGGRPQHLAQVAKQKNMVVASHEIIDREKTWFLNQCGLLGEGMDDDVMESGKFSTSAMLLAKELVTMDRERIKSLTAKSENEDDLSNDSLNGNNSETAKAAKAAKAAAAVGAGNMELPVFRDHELPSLPLWRARQVMTRPDYIQKYDNMNIFTIDSASHVKADSVPMMRAFHEICSQPGFDSLLDETCERVAAIESLGRTRELVAKDLVLGGHYKFTTSAPATRRRARSYGGNRKSHGEDYVEKSRYQQLLEQEYFANKRREKLQNYAEDAQNISGDADEVGDNRHENQPEYITKMTLHGGTRENDNDEQNSNDNDDDDDGPFNSTTPLQDLGKDSHKHWWEKRMKSNYATTFDSSDSIKQELTIRDKISNSEEADITKVENMAEKAKQKNYD